MVVLIELILNSLYFERCVVVLKELELSTLGGLVF